MGQPAKLVDNPIDERSIASEWHGRGYSCDLRSDPPGTVWHDCVHDADELFLLLEGSMDVSLEDSTHHLRPGDEVIVPAYARNTKRNVGTTEARWLSGYARDCAYTD